jgi:transposase
MARPSSQPATLAATQGEEKSQADSSCPTTRFVEVKDEAQLDMQSLHRARDRLVGERTALINQLRGLLLERGLLLRKAGASWRYVSTN